jgi:hypothetical protein
MYSYTSALYSFTVPYKLSFTITSSAITGTNQYAILVGVRDITTAPTNNPSVTSNVPDLGSGANYVWLGNVFGASTTTSLGYCVGTNTTNSTTLISGATQPTTVYTLYEATANTLTYNLHDSTNYTGNTYTSITGTTLTGSSRNIFVELFAYGAGVDTATFAINIVPNVN